MVLSLDQPESRPHSVLSNGFLVATPSPVAGRDRSCCADCRIRSVTTAAGVVPHAPTLNEGQKEEQ